MKKFLTLLFLKKLFVLGVLVLMLIHQQQVQSQALPVAPAANFVMNRAVGGVITRVAIARGFAANDPRIAATLVGASSSITSLNVASTVAGVGLAFVGAPVWLTVAASLGVFAIGSAIIAGNSSLKLGTGQLIVTSPNTATPPAYTPVNMPARDHWWMAHDAGVAIYRSPGCFASQECGQYPQLPAGSIPYTILSDYGQVAGAAVFAFFSLDEFISKYPSSLSYEGTYGVYTYKVIQGWASVPTFELSSNGTRRLVGQMTYQATCESPSDLCSAVEADSGTTVLTTRGIQYRAFNSVDAGIVIAPNEGPQIYKDLDTALPAIPQIAKTQQLSNDTIAKIADQAWMRAAAQPGYQGLPYSVTQPVTATDVATWRAENPASAPTIGDLLTPANNPGTSAVPISPTVTVSNPSADPIPNPNPNPTPNPSALQNVNVMNAPKIDLGADPGTPDPTLEATPTGWQILAPIMSLFPQLKNYQTPSHTSECPKPSFQVFGKSIVMDSHCTIAEQHRQMIAAIMLTTWLLVGLFIVLSA